MKTSIRLAIGLSLVAATLPVGGAFGQVESLGPLGGSLTREDARRLEASLRALLVNGDIGAVSSWRNDRSGNFGTMAVETRRTIKTLICKRVAHVIRIARERDTRLYRVTYCSLNGVWRIGP